MLESKVNGFIFDTAGIFRPSEKLSEIRSLLSQHLVHQDHTYNLSTVGKPLPDDTGTFASAGLVSIKY